MAMESPLTNCVTESGLLVFKLISGQLSRSNCYLEVLMDDMVFPSYSSSKVKSKVHEFNESECIWYCSIVT
jgi:Ca2+-dependent lipid-binding protein